MFIWIPTKRGDTTYTTECGRLVVEKLEKPGYNVLTDGALLLQKRGSKPAKFMVLREAKQAAEDFTTTGWYTSPSHSEPKYKTYDPETEGYGNPGQWQATFEATIGGKITTEELYADLGVSAEDPWATISKAYRAKLMMYHPDQQATGDRAKFEATVEAYKKLRARRRVEQAAAQTG